MSFAVAENLIYLLLEPLTGIEPVTSSLPRKCSTPELQRLGKVRRMAKGPVFTESGRRDSNSRHLAWKAKALPTELLPLIKSPASCIYSLHRSNILAVVKRPCGEWWIRTTEVVRQQIYSLSHLATLVTPLMSWTQKNLSRWRDSNPRPADYKSAALAS